MNHRKKKQFLFSLLTVIVLSATFVVSFYGKIIQDPNGHFFAENGDGLKNYYTYAYFIKHNVSATNFEGMNYPYGENYLYTDGHPFLASTLRGLSTLFPGIKDNSIGILNTLLLLSLVITSIFLFLIFYELRISYPLAILSSIAIMVLAPQILRFGGHYALAYSCFIPINLYLLLRFERANSKLLFTGLLMINNLFWLFTHAYLGMIIIGFTLLYLVIKIIYDRREKTINNRSYLDLTISIVVPIILFILFLNATDLHVGRTTNAGDLLSHSANFFTIFLPPVLHPISPFLISVFTDTLTNWEDLAYIGLFTDLILIVVIASIINKWVKSRKIYFKKEWLNNHFLRIALPASIIMLLFAMDYPFKLGLENMLEHKPLEILKNFRANGRFAWVFYFVITIVAVYLIDSFSNYLISINKKWIAIVLILFYPTSLFIEGYFYHDYVSKKITKSSNLFNIDQLDSRLNEAIILIDTAKYQAILPMPFYHTGSMNFRRNIKKKVERITLITSYHTGLPTFSARLTRVAIPESKKQVQLLSNSYYRKSIEADLTDNRPILIIRSKEAISKNEKFYLKRSQLIFDGGDFKFYEIDKDVFFKSTAEQELKTFNKLRKNLFPKSDFLVSDTTSYIAYYDFEELPNSNAHRGHGSFEGAKRDHITLIELDPADFELNTPYIASMWAFNGGPDFGQDQVDGAFILNRIINDELNWDFRVNPRYSQVINGDWSLVELTFKIKDENAKYELIMAGNGISKKTFYVDDLLIYKKGNKIYRLEKEDGKRFLFKNNHKILVE